jgi:hypothetical protein
MKSGFLRELASAFWFSSLEAGNPTLDRFGVQSRIARQDNDRADRNRSGCTHQAHARFQ